MSNDIVDEIKARLDIVDLISEYVHLKKAGSNYKGLCPFHTEKTPSFMVSPHKQMFHCFGCSKGGNIFTFVMQYHNMTFAEALRFLAQKSGLRLPSKHETAASAKRQSLKEEIMSIYNDALEFYVQNLQKSSFALQYLKKRALNVETVRAFSLGFAPAENSAIYNYLQNKKYSSEAISRSGLISSTSGKSYDFFRNRVMFPIYDVFNNCVAFGGRTMSDSKDIPKYINSPETMIFKKGSEFFGLNIAKNSEKLKKYAIIVEGYFDVMMCHQNGFDNAIAPLGTALTAMQLNKLAHYTSNVLLVFDADKAGIAAALRSIPIVLKSSLNAKIVVLPEGHDPDSLLRKTSADVFKKHISLACSIPQFMLRYSSPDRLVAIKKTIESIASCVDPIKQDDMIRELSELSKVSETAIRQQLALIKRSDKTLPRPLAKPQDSKIPSEERLVLNLIFALPSKASEVLSKLDLRYFESPIAVNLLEKTSQALQSNPNNWLDTMLASCSDADVALISQLSISEAITEQNASEILSDCIFRLQLRQLDKLHKIATENKNLEQIQKILSFKQQLLKSKEQR